MKKYNKNFKVRDSRMRTFPSCPRRGLERARLAGNALCAFCCPFCPSPVCRGGIPLCCRQKKRERFALLLRFFLHLTKTFARERTRPFTLNLSKSTPVTNHNHSIAMADNKETTR